MFVEVGLPSFFHWGREYLVGVEKSLMDRNLGIWRLSMSGKSLIIVVWSGGFTKLGVCSALLGQGFPAASQK